MKNTMLGETMQCMGIVSNYATQWICIAKKYQKVSENIMIHVDKGKKEIKEETKGKGLNYRQKQ